MRSDSSEGPESVSLNYELSALAKDGSSLSSWQREEIFRKGRGRGIVKFLKIDEVLLQRNGDYLPQDILTLCCKISKSEGNEQNICQCSARTRIKVEQISFLHEIERFSTLLPNVKQAIEIRSHSEEGSFISSSLYFTEGLCCEKKIMIEIVPSGVNQLLRKCKLYLLDKSGNEIECGKCDNRYDTECKTICEFPLSFTRQEALKRKNEYLPEDKLTLRYRCTFSSGLEYEAIEKTVYKMALPASIQEIVSKPWEKPYKSAEMLSSYPNALEDMKSLYLNQCLTDVELKTKTKSFPAHKFMLCARSPVFKAMLTNEMKEKNSEYIQVDDLEDDVVQKLLLFLYSDTLENLEWKLTTQLYYAADKYHIVKLKKMCSSFLVDNLIPTNAGELLLADTHSDNDLKKSVEDFILDHEKEVFGSDEWEMLMETHPVLVMKAMHLKYKRERN